LSREEITFKDFLFRASHASKPAQNARPTTDIEDYITRFYGYQDSAQKALSPSLISQHVALISNGLQ